MKLLTYIEFKNKWSSPNKNGSNEIPWGFSAVYANSGIKLVYDEWIELIFAFDHLDSNSRLDLVAVGIKTNDFAQK